MAKRQPVMGDDPDFEEEGAPSQPPPKKGREIRIKRRTVNVTNMNFSPEKAGDKKVERVDMSLEVLLEEADIPEFVHTRDNPLKVLWDKNGDPNLLELDKTIQLDLKVEGVAKFGLVNGTDQDMRFKRAILKKASIEPRAPFKAILKCQVRVDPAGFLEQLGALVIDGRAAFSFAGAGIPESDDGQGELRV